MPSHACARARTRAGTAATLVAASWRVAYGAGLVTGRRRQRVRPSSRRSDGVLDEAADADRRPRRDPGRPERARTRPRSTACSARSATAGPPTTAPPTSPRSAQSLEGRYTGVGLWVRQARRRGRASAASPPARPPPTAGVRAGDVLVAVDGTLHRPAPRSPTVAALLRGAPGTPARARAAPRRRARAPSRSTRATVTTDDVTVDRLAGDVTVVRVAAFTRGVGTPGPRRPSADAGPRRRGRRARPARRPGRPARPRRSRSPRPSSTAAPVVSYERRGAGTTSLDAVGRATPTVPLVVLVDGGTATAAEVVTGALQDRDRAVVVGSPHVRQGLGAGAVPPVRRVGDRAHRRPLPHARRAAASTASASSPTSSVDRDAARARRRDAARVEVLTGLRPRVGTSGRG